VHERLRVLAERRRILFDTIDCGGELLLRDRCDFAGVDAACFVPLCVAAGSFAQGEVIKTLLREFIS